MFYQRLRPVMLFCALGAALTAAESWESATRRLQSHASAQRGPGAVVEVERLDARTVRVRLLAQWPSFRAAAFQAVGRRGMRPGTWRLEGGSEEALVQVATLDPKATGLSVRLMGCDFNPKVMLRLPKPGRTAVGTILMEQEHLGGSL